MRNGVLRGVRTAPFLAAIVCFLFPFAHVSCNGEKAVTATGLQLVTGAKVPNYADKGRDDSARKPPPGKGGPGVALSPVDVPALPMASLALFVLAAGGLLALDVEDRRRLAASAGLAAVFFLLGLNRSVHQHIAKMQDGKLVLAAAMAPAYWCALAASAAAAVVSLVCRARAGVKGG